MKRFVKAAGHITAALVSSSAKMAGVLGWYRHFSVAALSIAAVGVVMLDLEAFPSASDKSLLAGLRVGSWDLLFQLRYESQRFAPALFGRSNPGIDDVLIVYLVPCPTNDSGPYVRALNELARHAPKAIAFDIAFTEHGWINKVARSNLVEAITALGASTLIFGKAEGKLIMRELARFIAAGPSLRAQASLSVPLDSRGQVRQYDRANVFEEATLATRLAEKLQRARTGPDLPNRFWINYHGPPGTIHAVTNLPTQAPGLSLPIENKIIFLGPGESPDDVHSAPFTRWSGKRLSGTEIQATAFLNIVGRGNGKPDDVQLLSRKYEFLIVMVAGLLIGGVFPFASRVSGVAVLAIWVVFSWLTAVFCFAHFNALLPIQVFGVLQPAAGYLLTWKTKSAFISHKASDGKVLARALRSFLRSRGVAVFLDDDYVLSGGKDPLLRQGIAAHRNFLLLVTADLVNKGSKPVEFEIKEAQESGVNRLVVVVVKDSALTDEQGRKWAAEKLQPHWPFTITIERSDLSASTSSSILKTLLENLEQGRRPDAFFSGSRRLAMKKGLARARRDPADDDKATPKKTNAA